MAVYSPDEGKLSSWNGLAPCYSGRKTLLGLLLSVRMKNRSYLQATPANGRWESEQEGKKESRDGRNRPVKSPRGTSQRFASLYPFLDLSHFYSHPHRSRDSVPFPRNSLASSRRSFLVRHTICSCEENVSTKWKRGSPIQCRAGRQRDQLGKLFAFRETL